jgi:hypothetical protein
MDVPNLTEIRNPRVLQVNFLPSFSTKVQVTVICREAKE